METINATRMNLLLKREEVRSASSGAELLRNKRDVLLIEFFLTLKSLIAQRENLKKEAYLALRSLFFALGLEGREKLTSASFIPSEAPSFEISYKNLLGLKIPEVEIAAKKEEDFFYSAHDGLAIEETKEQFQDFLLLVLKILPQELKLKRLGREIRSTSRKVNSLEKFIIPKLKEQVKFIQETLEEREREDVFRLKRIKKKKGGEYNE